MDKTADGSFNLQELRNTITTQENLGFVKLTGIRVGNANPPINILCFEADNSPAGPKPVNLVPISATTDFNQLVADQKAQGFDLLFDNSIFVASAKVRVAGFR